MTRPWLKLAVIAATLWCVVGLVVLASWGFFRDVHPPPLFVVLLSIGVLGGVARLLVGRRHGGKLIFWCRRFGDAGGVAGRLNRWHGRIIDEASRGLVMPVTLQDESVNTPPLVASAAVTPVFVGMLIVSIGSMLWLFERPWFETLPGKVAAFVIVVLGITAPSIVAVMVARWLGTRKVAPGNVAQIVRRAVRGRRSHAGMLVLGCRSEHWQACVAELLDLAARIIIDVSVPSGNVAWEVEAAAQRLGPGGLLLIQAQEKTEKIIQWTEEEGWPVLCYDISHAADELSVFSKSWRRDKHQLVDPDARLGPVGTAMADAIKAWLKQSEPVLEDTDHSR